MENGNKYAPWFQCYAAWIPDPIRGPKALEHYRNLYAEFQKQLQENAENMLQCKTIEDFLEIEMGNRQGAIFAVENGAALSGNLNVLQEMHQNGVKIMTLTWNETNEIGDGAGVEHPKGLTSFGKTVVKEMERLGVIVDVSHASDALFYDVAQLAEKPFIATHSNCRSICNHKRNLTDEQIKIICQRNGLIGLNFTDTFLKEDGHADFSDILRHVQHFLELGGENILAIGSDFDGTDLPASLFGIQSIRDLAQYFSKHAFSDELIDKIFYRNAFRFFRNYLKNQ